MDKTPGFDFVGVNASFVIHDGNGRILLQQRGQNARDEQGNWDIGGGAIEFGETLEETVRREVKEELGCDIIGMEFLTVYDAHRMIGGRKSHWIAIIYAVQVDPKQVRNNEPHKIDEIGWFTSTNLPSPRHSQFAKGYDVALKRGVVK